MTKPRKLGVWSGAAILAAVLGLSSIPTLAASSAANGGTAAKKKTSGQAMEEVVVTGSYIRQNSFNSSSPLTVVDQAAIANNATPNLGEVMVNQTFNYGSDFQTNTYAARAQIGTSTSANLRGLGQDATLMLLDGKRLIKPDLDVATDMNNLIPQIAISRIDVLKDGASAIYGTDAVAGVVNLITRKNFSGAKFNAFYQQTDNKDLHYESYEFLAGSDTDNGHITVALSYRFHSTLEQTERPQYLRGGFERSDTGNPGTYFVPVRGPTGAITGTTKLADPGCGAAIAESPGGTDIGSKGNYLAGDRRNVVEYALGYPAGSIPAYGTQDCGFHFGETWNFINPNRQWSFWGDYQFQITPSLSNEMEFLGNRIITDSRGSPQNPGGRTEEFPVVLGTNPGNPYTAYSDMNGNGQIDPGEELYAQDLYNSLGQAIPDGIPDRGTVDANGDGVPDVILSSTPFAAGGASNGIPFNEDVKVDQLRILGKIGLLPDANQPDALHADGSNTGNATYDDINYRLADTLTYTVPDSTWEVKLTGIMERNLLDLHEKNSSQNALEAGLRGLLKATQGQTYSYWNPFSTQALHCVLRVCSYTGTPDFANTRDVLNAITISAWERHTVDFWVADLIADGDIMDMPNGTLRGAFGAQYRKEQRKADLDSGQNQCDWHQGGCRYDWQASEDVYSLFFELKVPIIKNMTAQVATRYTDYGGKIGNSTDPKLAILYQPYDWLSLRGSYSTAFIAPSLPQQFESATCGLQTVQDQLTNDTSGTFRVGCVSGNPNLVPESADVWNLGTTLSLLDGNLQMSVDYSSYKFKDRITQTTVNNVLRADYANFIAAGGNNGPGCPDLNNNGVCDSVEAWVNGPSSDPAIQRDPVSYLVSRVGTSFVNAASMRNRAIDFDIKYNLSFNQLGDFTFDLAATDALEYSYDLGTGDPLDKGDGVGKQNEQVIEIPPIPKWRVNGSIHWFRGNQAAMIRLRWFSSVQMEFNSPGLQNLQHARYHTNTLPKFVYTDVNYRYTFPKLIGDRETTLEIGANNVFDRLPAPILNLGGIETYLYDVRGRLVYFRLSQDL